MANININEPEPQHVEYVTLPISVCALMLDHVLFYYDLLPDYVLGLREEHVRKAKALKNLDGTLAVLAGHMPMELLAEYDWQSVRVELGAVVEAEAEAEGVNDGESDSVG